MRISLWIFFLNLPNELQKKVNFIEKGGRGESWKRQETKLCPNYTVGVSNFCRFNFLVSWFLPLQRVHSLVGSTHPIRSIEIQRELFYVANSWPLWDVMRWSILYKVMPGNKTKNPVATYPYTYSDQESIYICSAHVRIRCKKKCNIMIIRCMKFASYTCRSQF